MSDQGSSALPGPPDDVRAQPEPRRPGRWARRLAWSVGAVLLLLALLGAGLIGWASSAGSLSQALGLAQRLLPPGQTLSIDGASGSLSAGGTVPRLRWSMPGTELSIEGLRLDWHLWGLLRGALDVSTLSADRVHLRSSPDPQASDASRPLAIPEQLSLPVELRLPLQIGQLEIEIVDKDGHSSVQTFSDIAAEYRYDHRQHALRLRRLRHEDQHLVGTLELGAQDLALHARIGAWFSGLAADAPQPLQALLQADGTLAGGEAARIDLRLTAGRSSGSREEAAVAIEHLIEKPGSGDEEAATDADATIRARALVHPWGAQPVQEAEIRLDRLNARAFHPGAPVSELSGRIEIRPRSTTDASAKADPASWAFAADLRNRAPRAWDAGGLPLRSLAARADFGSNRLRVEEVELLLEGSAPAGRVVLQGAGDLSNPGAAELQMALHDLDLEPLMAGLPHTMLSGSIQLSPLGSEARSASAPMPLNSRVDADIRNAAPGLIDRQRLPFTQLLAQATIRPQRWVAERVQAQLGKGQLQLHGEFEPDTRTLDLQGKLTRLPLVQVHSRLAAERAPDLDGMLSASGRLDSELHFDVDIIGGHDRVDVRSAARSPWSIRAIQAKGRWTPRSLDVQRAHVDAFQARIDAERLHLSLPGLDRIEAQLNARAPGLSVRSKAAIQAEDGGGQLEVNLASAEETLTWLRSLPVVGQALPALSARGKAQLGAEWNGGWRQWQSAFTQPGPQPTLRLDLRLSSSGLRLELPPAAEPHPAAKTKSESATSANRIEVQQLDVRAKGDLASVGISAKGAFAARGMQATLDSDMRLESSRTTGTPSWDLSVQRLSASTTWPKQDQRWQLQVGEGFRVAVQPGRTTQLVTSSGQATLTPPPALGGSGQALQLQWEPLRFSRTPEGALHLQSRGRLTGIVPAWIDAFLPDRPLASAGIQSSLVLGGDWDVDWGESLRLEAGIRRERGDVWIGDPGVPDAAANRSAATQSGQNSRGVPAGIRRLELRLRSSGGDRIQGELAWDSERAGAVQARAQTRLTPSPEGWRLTADAPLEGQVQAQVQDLGVWASLAPPGWRIAGAMNADLRVGGTVQAPQLNGPLAIDGLNLRSVLDGVDLHDGHLRAVLAGERIEIQELLLHGGTGSGAYVRGLSGNRTPAPTERGRLLAKGVIDWSGVRQAKDGQSGIQLDASASLERMQVLVREDRQISLSGKLSAALSDGALRLRGNLHVDRASISLPESGAPTLGEDVVVVRGSRPGTEAGGNGGGAHGSLRAGQPMDLELNLDLGRDFALQGYGITTRLEGELGIRSSKSGQDPISVTGTIRTDAGRYRAWGQALNVEHGIVLFNGPYDNPSLDMLAVRPNIEVRAGVRVTGTAQAPRVQLYSEPSMPDAETLSWVVTGRAPGAGGGGSMQQAALAFLAGRAGEDLAKGFGFDEVGLSEAGVSLGKRLSDQLYLTYEAGMAGAASTLHIFYDITRRLTARAQTGRTSAVDLIYTLSYD